MNYVIDVTQTGNITIAFHWSVTHNLLMLFLQAHPWPSLQCCCPCFSWTCCCCQIVWGKMWGGCASKVLTQSCCFCVEWTCSWIFFMYFCICSVACRCACWKCEVCIHRPVAFSLGSTTAFVVWMANTSPCDISSHKGMIQWACFLRTCGFIF